MAKADTELDLAKVTGAAQLVVALADADSRIAHFTGGKVSKLTNKIADGKKIATIELEQALDDLLAGEQAKKTLAAADKARAELQEKNDAEARQRASGNIPPSHRPRAAAKVEEKSDGPTPPGARTHAKVAARPGAAADRPGE